MATNPNQYDPWRFFKIGISLFLCLLLVSTLIYYVLGEWYLHNGYIKEHWKLTDCLFMVVITVTTIGYEAWVPIRDLPAAMWFTMFLSLAAISIPAFVISTVTALIVEGVVSNTVRRRKMQQEIAKMSGHVVVCGAGGTGEHCIEELVNIKRPFVVVDLDEERLKTLQEIGYFPYVVGHADRDEVLLQAGVPRASGLLSCLPEDKDNLFITLSARVLNPDLRIASKGVDQHVRKKMVIAGANSVVSPTRIGGLRMVSELLRPATTSFLDGMLREKSAVRFGELNVSRESSLSGKTLASSDLRSLADVLIVAARHPGVESFIYNPKADFQLEPGCVVVVLGITTEIEKLRPVFEPKT